MKYFAFIFCCLLPLIKSYGQNLLSQENRWNVTNNVWWQGLNTTTKSFRLDDTTTINGKEYLRVLESNDSLNINWNSTNIFLRQDSSSKVFIYQFGEERVLYDFNLELGDTFTVNDYCYLMVNNIDSVLLLNGEYAKKLTLMTNEDPSGIEINWLEGIGSDQGLTGYFTCGASNSFTELICFRKNEELLYPAEGLTCYINVTSVEDINDKSYFKINPTLVKSKLKVTSSEKFLNKELKLFSYTGQLMVSIYVESLEFQIDISHLQDGIYFLSIADKDGIIYTKSIVKI